MSADTFARGYSTFVSYLAEPAVRSLAIGCAAGVALWAFRVKRVTTRLTMWTAVLCVALAMPFLGALTPRVRLAVPATPLVKSLQASIWRAPAALRLVEAASNAGKSAASMSNQSAEKFDDGTLAYGAKKSSGRVANSKRAGLPALSERLDLTQDGRTQSAAIGGGKSSNEFANLEMASSGRSANDAAKTGLVSAGVSNNPLAASNARHEFAIPWAALLLGIYLVGATVLLARLLIGMWFSGRLARAAQDVNDREALRLMHFRSSIVGVENTPRLKESAVVTVPATVGLLRAAILLPADWRTWSEEQLDAILVHEISHIARRDALMQTLSLVHRAIFWFSPLSWWIDRQLTELAEQASDEAALAGGADRRRYAETLVGFFAQIGAAPGRVWWQGVSMAKAAKTGSAERRVDRILSWKGAISMRKSFAVAIVALGMPLVFLAAAVHPVMVYGQDKAQSDSHNVILPGGPKAPVLPKAPTGGVTAPPIAPGPQGGVVAPTLPPGPQGGVVAPRLSAAPVGTRRAIPSAAPLVSAMASVQAPETPRALPMVPGTVPVGSYTLVTPVAPPAQQTDVVVGSAPETELQAAMRLVQKADTASPADCEQQIRKAMEALARAQRAADEAGSSQMIAAQHALEKVKRLMEQNDASQIREAKAAQYEALREMQEAAEAAQEESHSRNVTITSGSYTSGGGPRYVMMLDSTDCEDTSCNVSMSGTDEDLEHARKLRRKISGPFIWFERDEKSYVITDGAFLAKVKALFAPEDALGRQEDELGRQEDALGKQEDSLGEQEDNIKVKVPDISPDIKRVQEELEALRRDGATQSELGRLQSELGALQGRVGRYQSGAGSQQAEIGRQQAELGQKQAALGRQQAELGRQQAEISRRASQQLRGMFDDAIAKGIAKPE